MSMQAVCCDPALLTPHSFRMLYEESHTMIYKIAYSMLKNEHDAWDVTQNVYIKILMKAESLREPEKIRNWMVTMTYNECKNMLKAQRRTLFRLHREADISELETFTDIESPELGPIDCMEAGEMRDELRTFLNQLPDEQKNTLFLYYYEQRSIDEIASLCGCTANTVKSRLNYGKKKMRHMISDYENKYHVTLRCSVLIPILHGIWHIKNATLVASSIAAAAAACVISTNVLPASNQPKLTPTPESYSVAAVCESTKTTTAATIETTVETTTAVTVRHAVTAPQAEPLAVTTESTTTTTVLTTTTETELTTTTTVSESDYSHGFDWCWGDNKEHCWWKDWDPTHWVDDDCWNHEHYWWEEDDDEETDEDVTEPESAEEEETEEEEVLLPDCDFTYYRDDYQRPDCDRWWWDCDDCEDDTSDENESDSAEAEENSAELDAAIDQLEIDAQSLLEDSDNAQNPVS